MACLPSVAILLDGFNLNSHWVKVFLVTTALILTLLLAQTHFSMQYLASSPTGTALPESVCLIISNSVNYLALNSEYRHCC